MADPNLQQKLDAIFNAHMDAELSGNLDETLATMAPNPHLVNVPTMVGRSGPGERANVLREAVDQASSSRPT
ncbi:MAG: hypothetical protein U5P41_11440 [Gammaproteobacteria bacterium]|nr:hypothetical protein [Gammaproteobacteria bacterium]